MRLLALAAATLACAGCASIVSHSKYPVELTTNPAGAHVEIVNRAGAVVYSGTTPAKVTLKSGAGYFKKEQYTIKASLDGASPTTATISPSLNGWYWGNLVIGGVIGMVIVDPLTGAMYSLPKEYTVQLTGQKAAEAPAADAPTADEAAAAQDELQIVSLDAVPEALRAHLVRLN